MHITKSIGLITLSMILMSTSLMISKAELLEELNRIEQVLIQQLTVLEKQKKKIEDSNRISKILKSQLKTSQGIRQRLESLTGEQYSKILKLKEDLENLERELNQVKDEMAEKIALLQLDNQEKEQTIDNQKKVIIGLGGISLTQLIIMIIMILL